MFGLLISGVEEILRIQRPLPEDFRFSDCSTMLGVDFSEKFLLL
jgi:hypothetical protein